MNSALTGPQEIDCPECDGHGYTTGSEHAYDSDCGMTNPKGGCSGCPVPVQEMCDYCRCTGRIQIDAEEAQA